MELGRSTPRFVAEEEKRQGSPFRQIEERHHNPIPPEATWKITLKRFTPAQGFPESLVMLAGKFCKTLVFASFKHR
jgi:hypothetical protein